MFWWSRFCKALIETADSQLCCGCDSPVAFWGSWFCVLLFLWALPTEPGSAVHPDLTTCEFPKSKYQIHMEPDWTNTALRLSFSASLLYELGHFLLLSPSMVTNHRGQASGTWKVAGLHLRHQLRSKSHNSKRASVPWDTLTGKLGSFGLMALNSVTPGQWETSLIHT